MPTPPPPSLSLGRAYKGKRGKRRREEREDREERKERKERRGSLREGDFPFRPSLRK